MAVSALGSSAERPSPPRIEADLLGPSRAPGRRRYSQFSRAGVGTLGGAGGPLALMYIDVATRFWRFSVRVGGVDFELSNSQEF